MSFTAEQSSIVLWRDGYLCCLCKEAAEVANHRVNRGMGGRPSLDILSNACALCHRCNGLIESDAEIRQRALDLGVKLLDGQDPHLWSYVSPFYGIPVWVWDDGHITFVSPDEVES